MLFIKNLKNLSKAEVAIAGGKGASLGEMMRAGMLVPPGFVVLSTACEEFLKRNGLNVEIDAILHTVDLKNINTIEHASEKIRALILNGEMPAEIDVQVQKAYKALKTKYVAVRSSSVAEDSIKAAWPGQLESYLNTAEKNLLKNIKKCWASLYTPRAIFYRFEKKLQKQKILVAVVVQKMIASEVSGIAFSIQPVTQNKKQLIIEAGFGLGEAVVSGQITPDSYVVDKRNWDILAKNINSQEKAIGRSLSNGNHWKTVKKERNNIQKLADREIVTLAKLVVQIEKLFGLPVDIEWAQEKGDFYITQCRPITTLKNIGRNKSDILSYIKSQKWFLGVRAEESLFYYSAKYLNREKLISQYYKSNFVETLLFPLRNDYPVRVFNLNQAKEFHLESLNKIRSNPKVLLKFIDRDNKNWQEIDKIIGRLAKQIKLENFEQSKPLFLILLKKYGLYGNFFSIIFSLGMVMTKNQQELGKKVSSILEKHDFWRNSVAFKEENLGQIIYLFLKMLITQKNLSVSSAEIMKYLTAEEVFDLLNNKLSQKEITGLIRVRAKYGYIFTYFHGQKFQGVIDNQRIIEKIKVYFGRILNREKDKSDVLMGDSAFIGSGKIKAKVVVINDKNKLIANKISLAGKILVAIQTTPHFIPYLKNVKGIITDEGGITCHAAIISREFKIPCIVGIKNATKVLKTGDLVELNTEAGIIIKI